MFPDQEAVREMQAELDKMIQKGVESITALLRQGETSYSSGISKDDPDHDGYNRNKSRKPVKSLNNEDNSTDYD